MMLFSISLMKNRTLYWAPSKITGVKSLIKPVLSNACGGGGGVVDWYERMSFRVDSLALEYRPWGDVTLELWRIESTKPDIIVNYIIITVNNKFALPQLVVRALDEICYCSHQQWL